MSICRSRLSDAEAVCRIYGREVLTSTATFDTESRTLAEQEASMRLRGERHPLLVAVARDEMLGYGSISAYSAKPGYAHTVEDSVYAAEDHRGYGVGDGSWANSSQRPSVRGITASSPASLLTTNDRSAFTNGRDSCESAWNARWAASSDGGSTCS